MLIIINIIQMIYETFLEPWNEFHINDNSFQIFHRNNKTVMRDDKNNTQMNNQSNGNQKDESNLRRSNRRHIPNPRYYNSYMIN